MTGLIIVTILVFALLVLVAGVRPQHDPLSEFELERRVASGDDTASKRFRREQLLVDVESLFRIVTALLLVVFVLVVVATFGWLFGSIIATFAALEYGALARVPLWRSFAQKLYEQYESYILRFVERFSGVFRFIRNVTPEPANVRLDSKEELEHLVKESGQILTTDEKQLIVHSLSFDVRRVDEIMTPRSVIDSIQKSELLGPLTLNDLHQTGHSRFPVIDGDIDHVVGVLHIQNLLTLDKKRSVTAGTAMDPHVYYIREDHSLRHALAGFLRTHHHLFIVVNEFRETVGVLSLEDTLEALLGRKITDEFDAHEDLRAVAAHNPRKNNHPTTSTDV